MFSPCGIPTTPRGQRSQHRSVPELPGAHHRPLYLDCDDAEPLVNPDALEMCEDLIDNDCDTLVDCDDSDCFLHPSCARDRKFLSFSASLARG